MRLPLSQWLRGVPELVFELRHGDALAREAHSFTFQAEALFEGALAGSDQGS